MQIHFIVYGEPVPKARAKHFFNKKTNHMWGYTPKKTVKGEFDFKMQALPYKPQEIITSAVFLQIKIFKSILKSFSNNKKILAEAGTLRPTTRPDWDNYGKLITDALNGIFWIDDSQIVGVEIYKYYSNKPRIEITINWEGEEKNENN